MTRYIVVDLDWLEAMIKSSEAIVDAENYNEPEGWDGWDTESGFLAALLQVHDKGEPL